MYRTGGIADARLAQERKSWRKDHPHGFSAKPEITIEGKVNLRVWNCTIPGMHGTDWQGGVYPLSIYFKDDYPNIAPECKFPRGFFHPNVFPSGRVCLSILSKDWSPDISIKQILLGIQNLLHHANPYDPAQEPAKKDFIKDTELYRKKVRQQAIKYHV